MAILQTPRDRAAFLILALGTAILLALAPFLSGLLGAAVLYVVYVKPYQRLCGVMKPGLAAAMTLVIALLIIALPLTWLIGIVIDQAPDSLRAVQSSWLFARVGQLRIGSYDVGAEVAKASGTLVSWLSGQVFAFVGSATSAALNLVIAFFALYYILRSGANLSGIIRGYIPFSLDTADELRDRFFSVTEATLLGTVLVAIIQGGLIGAGFWMVSASPIRCSGARSRHLPRSFQCSEVRSCGPPAMVVLLFQRGTGLRSPWRSSAALSRATSTTSFVRSCIGAYPTSTR